MMELVRICAVWPTEMLGSSLNQILGWTTVRKSYSRALEQGPLLVVRKFVPVVSFFRLTADVARVTVRRNWLCEQQTHDGQMHTTKSMTGAMPHSHFLSLKEPGFSVELRVVAKFPLVSCSDKVSPFFYAYIDKHDLAPRRSRGQQQLLGVCLAHCVWFGLAFGASSHDYHFH